MPTNTEITSSIVAGSVPPDRECVKNLSEILQGVQDFASIQTATPDATPSGPGDSVAEQALNTANTALAAVESLQAAQKQVRTSGIIPIPSGDSPFSYTFTPPMPSDDFDVYVTYYAGADTAVADNKVYNWRVLESSITVNGFTIRFDNTPTNTKAAIRVVER